MRYEAHSVNESAVRMLMAEARNCAMVMLESATFIQGELATVQIPDALRVQIEQVCSALVGTKHDVVSELFELDELLDSKSSAAVVVPRVKRIVLWLHDGIPPMHELVKALEAVGKQDPECRSAHVLVAESATSVINAFLSTRAAGDSVLAQADEA